MFRCCIRTGRLRPMPRGGWAGVNTSRSAAGVAISWRILYLAAYGKMERKWVLVEIFSDCVGCLLFEAVLGGWQIWGLQSAWDRVIYDCLAGFSVFLFVPVSLFLLIPWLCFSVGIPKLARGFLGESWVSCGFHAVTRSLPCPDRIRS